PDLTALITSRARLRLTGEHDLPVAPLALPEVVAGRRWLVDDGEQAAAVRLFVARAQAVDPSFRLNPANAPVVAEICRRLDGLPLAIELAAARSRVLPPPALLTRLGHRLPLLDSGPRDQPDRLRTMRNAIAWSYDLLRPEEQAAFRCLAVFVGGFGLEGAERVCGASLNAVGALLEQSLLQPLAAGDEPRYAMLETVREFGLEQLTAAQEEAATRDRHAAWYLDLVERSHEARWRGPMPPGWLDRIEVEHDNLRIALSWLERNGSAEDSLRLAGELASFWLRRSYRTEGRGWLDRAFDRARTAPVDPTVHVHALVGAASLAFTQSDYPRAAALAEEGLARSRDLGHDYTVGLFLNVLGAVARAQGFPSRAAADFEQALALFRAEGVPAMIGVALCNLGALACGQGKLDRAAAALAEAHALFDELNDSYWLAVTLSNL
ncbi:MAG: ATP-binding protein, partial [Dehalococcoidia bacterium]